MNLFQKAAKAAPKAKAKGKMQTVVPVAAGTALTELSEVRNTLAAAKAREAELLSDLLPLVNDKFLEMYRENKSKPENFIAQGEDGGRMLVIVQDKYEKVEDPKLDAIKALLPEQQARDVIEETTSFGFNEAILNKHADAISKAIMGIKTMTKEEKEALITSTQKCAIRKGVLGKLLSFSKPDTLFALVKPTVQFKNVKAEDDE